MPSDVVAQVAPGEKVHHKVQVLSILECILHINNKPKAKILLKLRGVCLLMIKLLKDLALV